jgi:acetyl-CoA C-acetyltransferase
VADRGAPVVVGAGSITQRATDPADAGTAFDLMVEAAARAEADAGASGLLKRVNLVLVPEGIWRYRDAGRAVAAHFGATAVRSVVANIGILQQTLLTRAAEAVASGEAEVVLVCGAEAKARASLAARAGVTLADVDPSTADPDEILNPARDVLTMTEIERDLAVPAHQYAILESAIGHAAGRTPAGQREHAAELWARFAAVAAANERAWDRAGLDATAIGTPGPGNRMIATPYTKLLCSQWNVDQAAALVVTTAETARTLGVDESRWVHAGPAAESDQMVPMPCRAELHRWPAFGAVAEALGLTGADRVRPDVVELYSCFPAAVEQQADVLGYPHDAPLTITGGMTFGGGPLNNAVLQGMVPLVERLRAAPDAVGLITSVSGILTKTGGSLWSARPFKGGFRSLDVTEVAAERTGVLTLLPDATGAGTIVGATVLYDGDAPSRAVAIVDVEGGRTVARAVDVSMVREMTEVDPVGRPVAVTAAGEFGPA